MNAAARQSRARPGAGCTSGAKRRTEGPVRKCGRRPTHACTFSRGRLMRPLGGARVAETDNVTVVWRGKYKEVER